MPHMLLRLIPFVLGLTACAFLSEEAGPTPEAVETSGRPPETATPKAEDTPAPTSEPEIVTAVPTLKPATSSAATSGDLSLHGSDVTLFPLPALYDGDLASFQVRPHVPEGLAPNDVTVHVLVDGELVVSSDLNWRSLGGDVFGMYQWVWDTGGEAGDHTVTVILDPEDEIRSGDSDPTNNQVTLNVAVQPRSALKPTEAGAKWITVTSDCCAVHLVSGTAAYRDLPELLTLVDSAFQEASERLEVTLDRPYDVYLIDRAMGQGGYANDYMVVSYLDRDYAGGGLMEVLVHEAIHLIDHQFAPDRITFLSEGLAVWATGGHYQQEDIGQRMAVLVDLGLYLPVSQVIDSFLDVQHEIGYLEAAGFVSYLVDTYGLNRVKTFYGDVTVDDGPSLSAAVDANLRIHFHRTLQQVEADWLASLPNRPRDRRAADNLQTTIRYYDIMRHYQQTYDPSAYYLSAWLPPPDAAERRGATADLTRHPESVTNIALETMLIAADEALRIGNYGRANALLDSVSRVLDNNGRFLDPLANAYLNIVVMSADFGYEVQKIELVGTRATVEAIPVDEDEPRLIELQLAMEDQAWVLAR